MTPEQKAEMEAYMKAGTPGGPTRPWLDGRQLRPQGQELARAGAPAMEETGTATRTMALGGRVLVEDVKSTMMGMPFTGHGMMGYDNVTGKYWSTWMDSMSTGMMMSEGTCDAKGRPARSPAAGTTRSRRRRSRRA